MNKQVPRYANDILVLMFFFEKNIIRSDQPTSITSNFPTL